MLKISVIDRANQRHLVLEGKLIGPWAAELKTACDVARAGFDGGEIIVEMKQVTAISQEGENVLFELMQQRVKIRCRDVFTKQVLKQLARRGHPEPSKNNLGPTKARPDCDDPHDR